MRYDGGKNIVDVKNKIRIPNNSHHLFLLTFDPMIKYLGNSNRTNISPGIDDFVQIQSFGKSILVKVCEVSKVFEKNFNSFFALRLLIYVSNMYSDFKFEI